MAPPERETKECRKERAEQERGARAKADGKSDHGPDKDQEPEIDPVPS